MNTLNTSIMNLRSFQFGNLMRGALLALVGSLTLPALAAQETPPSPPSPPVEAATPQPQAEEPGVTVEVEVDDFDKDFDDAFNRRSHDHSVIVKFDDANVAAHETVDAVVSIGGSSTVAGTVREAVVSIFGNTRVTGPVGDGAVAIFGDVYVNSRVRGDVAAIFGNVELGPEARIGGELVVVSAGGARIRGNRTPCRKALVAVQLHGMAGARSHPVRAGQHRDRRTRRSRIDLAVRRIVERAVRHRLESDYDRRRNKTRGNRTHHVT